MHFRYPHFLVIIGPVKILVVIILLVSLGVATQGSTESLSTDRAANSGSSASLRDPFQPPNLKPKRVVDESRPELERYELSELRLTGVATAADGNLSASIETASGRGFMVKKGSLVGTNRGKIIDISMDRIVIEETVVNQSGQSVTSNFEMSLRGTKERDAKSSPKKAS